MSSTKIIKIVHQSILNEDGTPIAAPPELPQQPPPAAAAAAAPDVAKQDQLRAMYLAGFRAAAQARNQAPPLSSSAPSSNRSTRGGSVSPALSASSSPGTPSSSRKYRKPCFRGEEDDVTVADDGEGGFDNEPPNEAVLLRLDAGEHQRPPDALNEVLPPLDALLDQAAVPAAGPPLVRGHRFRNMTLGPQDRVAAFHANGPPGNEIDIDSDQNAIRAGLHHSDSEPDFYALMQNQLQEVTRKGVHTVHWYTAHTCHVTGGPWLEPGLVLADGNCILQKDFAMNFHGCMHITVLVLAFCEGDYAAFLASLCSYIPFVIYCNAKVRDVHAISFAEIFLQNATSGAHTIQEAFDLTKSSNEAQFSSFQLMHSSRL